MGAGGEEEKAASLRRHPEQGALLEAESLPVEGRAAGQTGGGSPFLNTGRLPACAKAGLQEQDRGSRQGMAVLGTDQLSHRGRSSNSKYGGNDKVTWGPEQERERIQGDFLHL